MKITVDKQVDGSAIVTSFLLLHRLGISILLQQKTDRIYFLKKLLFEKCVAPTGVSQFFYDRGEYVSIFLISQNMVNVGEQEHLQFQPHRHHQE